MRVWILAMMGGLLPVLTGCHAAGDHTIARHPAAAPPVAGQRADLATALLFDRKPGCYHASDFATRSDWPSTDSFYSPGQVIYFNERFVDITGRRFDESDYTYRRFDTVRVGVGFR
jgi:hypothetical protein